MPVSQKEFTCMDLQALAHGGQQVQQALDGHIATPSSIGTSPHIPPPDHIIVTHSEFLFAMLGWPKDASGDSVESTASLENVEAWMP